MNNFKCGKYTMPLGRKTYVMGLLPVLEALQGKLSIPVSVDTFFAGIAREALKLGVSIINDVTGFEESEMLRLVASSDCGCILMHPGKKKYPNGVTNDVRDYLKKGALRLKMAGVESERICLDPGIGFSVTEEECLELIRNTRQIKTDGFAYLVGASRKRVIGKACAEPEPKNRLAGTVAIHTAVQLMGADILRVHDVKEAVQACRMTDAIKYGFSE